MDRKNSRDRDGGMEPDVFHCLNLLEKPESSSSFADCVRTFGTDQSAKHGVGPCWDGLLVRHGHFALELWVSRVLGVVKEQRVRRVDARQDGW